MTIRVNDKILGVSVAESILVDTIEISPDIGDGIFVGEDYCWRDITSPVTVEVDKHGSGPAYIDYGDTGIYQYQFDVALAGQETFHMFHMPHDWVPGTDIYIHAHWSTALSADGNDVVWGFDAVWARRDSIADEPFASSALQFEITGASSTTAMSHLVHEVPLTEVDGNGTSIFDVADIEVDGIFLVKSYLKANNCDQNPFLHTVDLHYQSSNIGTKNKASNFYT